MRTYALGCTPPSVTHGAGDLCPLGPSGWSWLWQKTVPPLQLSERDPSGLSLLLPLGVHLKIKYRDACVWVTLCAKVMIPN